MKNAIRTISAAALLVAASLSAAVAGDDHARQAELGGYCPVAYIAAGKAVKGNPDLAVEFAGRRYDLANEKALEMFQADPSKYQVACDGYCATAAAMGKKLEADPTLFRVVDGRTYLFSSEKARRMFDADPAGTARKAEAQWAKITLAYDGYCPVAYVAAGKPVEADPNITLEVDGRLIGFANQKAFEMFQAHPDKYHVAYDGHCATAMSMGKTLPADPTLFTVVGGTIYLFSSEKAKRMFDARPAEVAKRADRQWTSIN